ncbi:transposase [Streptomyces yangpuensis]|uniref:transposase n=1 Tax=Streptomyces yangpuensis TaxID=1648182 RepID=UPI0037F58F17
MRPDPVLSDNHSTEAGIVELVEHSVQRDALTVVSQFRSELYACLVSRSTDGPVRSLVDLALAPEHRRGHGALYAGINRDRIDIARLRRALAAAAPGRRWPTTHISDHWLAPASGKSTTASTSGSSLVRDCASGSLPCRKVPLR